jgi:hypothetical protein
VTNTNSYPNELRRLRRTEADKSAPAAHRIIADDGAVERPRSLASPGSDLRFIGELARPSRSRPNRRQPSKIGRAAAEAAFLDIRLRNSAARGRFIAMIGIAITPAAQAIKASLLGTADATPRPGPDGLIRIWLDRKFVDRLAQMRGPGESYSDVILRLAKEDDCEE